MKSKVLVTILIFTTASLLHAQVTDKMITSWWFNTTNQTYNSNLVNVEAVYYTTTKVYVKSTGIPSYYTDNNTLFDAVAKTNVFILPRTQTVPTSDASRTYLRDEGNVAVFIDGSLAFSPCDGKSYSSGGVWHQLAYKFENNDFDSYLGHSNPGGTYHHHVKPTPLYSSSTTTHSGIVGYAFDGYPIYGPYAYTNTDGTGAIKRMTTSWKTRSISNRTTLPDGSTASQTGPTLASQALGKYFEDYEYSSGYGDLDRYNGRTCVTPEYPSGTYCYFLTVDASGNPEFPYIIGDYFYATPLKNAMGKIQNSGTTLTSNTVAAGATLYSSVLPVELTKFTATLTECTVKLNWQSATELNFDHYEVEWSENDGKTFERLGSLKAKGSDKNYAFRHNPMDGTSYYRLKMVDNDGTARYSSVIAVPVECGFKNVKIDVFPNPFHGSLAIDLSSENPQRINIYNMTGQVIYTTTAQGFTKVDMSNQPSGSYVVEVIDTKMKSGFMKRMVKP